MRAVIYARRSTDEHQAASLEVQIGEARRFCELRGWTVVETFLEDAVSRAEFVKRPALIAMLNAAERRACDVVVTRDETRLGGDTFRTGLLVQNLLDSGARLFYYVTAEEVSLDDPTQKLVMAARAWSAEIERAKLASRTREHLEVKARQGVNVGGRVYGYDNVEIRDGERRLRVEYRINDAQAAVIREVFTRYVAGDGVRAIARSLNARGVPSPHAGRRGTGSWAPSTVMDLVKRERYRGVVTWGKKGSAYRHGTRVEFARPAEEWTQVHRADLQIVDDRLWAAAIAMRAPAPTAKRKGREATHLLSGIARCSECGGPMQADRAKWGSAPRSVYQCAWSRARGREVCENRLRRPIEDLEGPIVAMLRDQLTPPVIARALREVRRLFEVDQAPATSPAEGLETELRRVQSEIGRIATAIATTDAAPDALTRALVEREGRARQLREELAAARAAGQLAGLRWTDVEAEASRRLADLQGAFSRNVAEARVALREILAGPITCSPVEISGERRYRVSGALAVGQLISTGVFKASPGGFEQNPGSLTIAFVDGRIAA
jgi:site-specific DNA recombinase